MHGALPGGDPMWFVSTDGYDLHGTTPIHPGHGDDQRPLEFADLHRLRVAGEHTTDQPGAADQPGAPGSVATNDVTTTAVDFLDGKLVTALPAPARRPMASRRRKVHWYEVDVSGGTPSLVQEGLDRSGCRRGDFLPVGRHRPCGQHRHLLHGVVLDRIRLGIRRRSHRRHAARAQRPQASSSALAAARCPRASAKVTMAAPSTIPAPDCSGEPTSTSALTAAPTSGGPRSPRSRRSRGSEPTIYSVNANAGDNLHFATTTPAGGPNEFVNNLYPELLLYDPNGNLVAVAAGNASDGRNSVIDFTVPGGDAGKWTIEVTPSPNTPLPTQGEYGLLVTGATGALSPFVVTSTSSRRRCSRAAAFDDHRDLQ